MEVDAMTAWLLFVSALVAALAAIGFAWRRWVGPALRSVRDGAVLVVDGVRHIREVQDRELLNGSDITLRDEIADINRKLGRDYTWRQEHDRLHDDLGLIVGAGGKR